MSRLSEDISYFMATVQALTTVEEYKIYNSMNLLTNAGKESLLKILEEARKEFGAEKE